jgi:glycosyltransferase involved in cell wall biosynthesis
MKFVLATPLFPPDSGGPATDAAQLHAELPKYGIETVVCSFGSVRHLPSGIRHLVYACKLLKCAKGADGIISLDTFSVCIPAAIVSKLIRKPLIVRVPGDFAWEQATQRFGVTDSIEVFQKKRYGWRVELLRSLQKFAARSAALLVVPSDFFQAIVLQWGIAPDRVKRIYLGLDFSEGPVAPSNVPEGKILFSLGRFVPWKGFSMLISLISELSEQSKFALSEWHLVIAGDGPLRAELEKQVLDLHISERVTFTGFISHAEALGWLRQADAFALNTSFESFSFQILEAMASGVPVITTAVGSIPELITNNVEGILCAPDDREAFKSAILSTQTDAEKWHERTEAAKLKAAEFSIEKSVRLFADELIRLCD